MRAGAKVTASKLKEGKTYLHRNTAWCRTIVWIDGNKVCYDDPYTRGICTKAHFVTVCPHEAIK